MKLQEQYQKKFREGALYEKRNNVRNMIENNVDDENICKYANCTQEFIDEVRKAEDADC